MLIPAEFVGFHPDITYGYPWEWRPSETDDHEPHRGVMVTVVCAEPGCGFTATHHFGTETDYSDDAVPEETQKGEPTPVQPDPDEPGEDDPTVGHVAPEED
jgi:hypothetical protein